MSFLQQIVKKYLTQISTFKRDELQQSELDVFLQQLNMKTLYDIKGEFDAQIGT